MGAWMGLGRGGIEPLCCLGMPSASIVRCAGGKTVNAAGSWKIMLHASWVPFVARDGFGCKLSGPVGNRRLAGNSGTGASGLTDPGRWGTVASWSASPAART